MRVTLPSAPGRLRYRCSDTLRKNPQPRQWASRLFPDVESTIVMTDLSQDTTT
jgi:hypothetical protein